MIKFNDIEIKYDDFVAIENLNLEINQGEFFTFLGPSGCGKTTTLRSLVGFVNPSNGSIYVDDEDITHKPIEKRNIGMVFQSYALFPTMTVKENITFALKEKKLSKDIIRERLSEVADLVNLTDEQLNKNVSELSGGQQQRVAIARSLALKPSIICLDEPLSNLDAQLRKQLRSELKRIQRDSGTTMIYVTHDQEEALTLSDNIAVFNNGHVEQVGTPIEVYNNPKTKFVTEFIGDSNLLSTEMKEGILATNQDVPFKLEDTVYVRVENMKETISSEALAHSIHFKAIFEDDEFYGVTRRKEFKAFNSTVYSVSTIDSQLTDPALELSLYINKRDFIVFPGGD